MAKTVYTPEEIELQDGTLVTVKPLPIARLKRALNFEIDGDDDNAGYDYIVGVVKICLEGTAAEDLDLEEVLDVPTGKRIINVCTGVDLDSANLILQAAAQSGQIST